MKISTHPYTLQFTFPAGTSRGVLSEKNNIFIVIHDDTSGIAGIGECGPLKGLSIDDIPELPGHIESICDALAPIALQEILDMDMVEFFNRFIPATLPAVRFGFETALMDLKNGGKRCLMPNSFYERQAGIPINGLVWMGEIDFMRNQIRQKLDQGYEVIKIKVGAIDFQEELSLLRMIRESFKSNDITIRLDANGAFDTTNVHEKLKAFSEYDIHSIEQPVKAGQWELMAEVCDKSPIPIALDEELIGIQERQKKIGLLEYIKPQYIILKPTLVGGLHASEEWVKLAEEREIGWWMTSALESNIGLNAIAQYTSNRGVDMPQGLGTGQLYHNNIPSPLAIKKGALYYESAKGWETDFLTS